MAQYVVTDTELEAVADAIRLKGGTSADLEWTSGYIDAIRAISGGGGSTSDPAELFDIMADCYALNSSAGYNILSSMYVSHTVGDKMEIWGRYFQRDTAVPVLIVNQTSKAVGSRGYVIYSPSQDAFSGTYSEYGDIAYLTTLISPSGNTFYRMNMGSPWVTSTQIAMTISNGGNTIASLAANGFLLNYDLDDSAMVELMGRIMDALFFEQAGGGYWQVRYYNSVGVNLLHTEYVQDGQSATWGAGRNWSVTPGGTASSGVLDHISDNIDVYVAIPANSYSVSSGSVIETSSATAALENGGLYLFTTVYSGNSFSNATILAGNTSAVYNATGYDRVACMIRATGTPVSYYRYGSIDTNKYARFLMAYNGISVDSDVTLTLGSTTQATGSFSAVAGKMYRVLTGVGAVAGNFTGGTIIAPSISGDPGKQNLNALIVAEDDTIAYSGGGTLYYTPVTVYVNGTEVPYLYGE